MHKPAHLLFIFLTAAGLWGQNLDQNPGGVTLRMYLKPDASRLHVLVRAPLAAWNGITLPYREANGELDLQRLDAMLPSLARWWLVDHLDVYEGEKLLSKPEIPAARVSLPSDDAFSSYDEAWRHIFSPKLPPATQIFREQAMVDVALDYDIHSASAGFSIRPSLGQLGAGVTTDLTFLAPESSRGTRTFEYTGDPGRFFLDPTVGQVFRRFVRTGVLQILNGTDYLLFLFCWALDMRNNLRKLFSFAAIFAGVQSLALGAAAYGFTMDALWFPLFISALSALAILFLAFEIMANKTLIRPRWVFATMSGVIFGYGFSFALNPARQFAGSHALAAVLSYDIGLQGAIFPVLPIFAAALLISSRLTRARFSSRTETVVMSVLAADLAWHRLTDRVERLRHFNFHWLQEASLNPLSWAAMILLLGGAVLVGIALRQRRAVRTLKPMCPSSAATPDPDLSS